MTPGERFPDDAVLRRVAAVRPAMREEDLSPTGERAMAIADRVLSTPRWTGAAGAPASTRWSLRTDRRPVVFGALGVAAAAACVALLFTTVVPGSRVTNGRVTADLINIRLVPAPHSRSAMPLGRRILRTPLGVAISRGYQETQQNVQTGTPAQNRVAISHLTSNQKACDQAATSVSRVHARPGQRAFQRYWVEGVRLQATADRELVAALRAADSGHNAFAKRELTAALSSNNRADAFTAYAEQALEGPGSPGPLPRPLR